MAETQHIGRKISRVRELRGLKQEALAIELGISQQAMSKIEQSEKLEEETLERIAKKLGVSTEAIKNYNDEAVVNYFNTFGDHSFANANGFHNVNCTFNPLDKLMEVVEDNKQLYEENKKLYERLLQAEKEKNELLKQK